MAMQPALMGAERLQTRLALAYAGLAVLSAATVLGLHPGPLRFAPISAREVAEILSPLVLLSLFIERAVEVFVAAWRDGPREALELACQEDGTGADRRAGLRRSLGAHRDQTRSFALLASLALGVLASTLGVRALALLVDADMLAALESWQAFAFALLDVAVTGALLAGGADGLHKVIATFTAFLEQSSRRIKGG